MEKQKPVVEETKGYRVGLTILSDSDYEKPKSGISTFNSTTAKTEKEKKG